jgi:hypothetical protein
LITKDEVLISDSTLVINESVFNDLLMALLHMAQVKPLACKVADLNCAEADTPINRHVKKKNFFIETHLVIEKIAAENGQLSAAL